MDTTLSRRRSIARAVAALALAVLAARSATGQDVKQKLDISREAVESQRRVLVSGALPLDDKEAAAFWPLYDAFEKERRPLDERANKLVADLLARSAGLTDAQARTMVAEALAIEEGKLQVRRTYLARMLKAIPPSKVARFYQIDNKLDAVVRADIARQIPLTP